MKVLLQTWTGELPQQWTLLDQVHVWQVSLDETAPVPLILTQTEQLRLNRFRHLGAQRQFGVTRSRLRELLGAYLGLDPMDVPIRVAENGKPELPGHPLHFNVSHTDTLAVLAFATVPVGVDVEFIREMPNAASLVRRFFEPDEQEQFFRLSECQQQMAFFRGWTGKEAVLKGLGCGTRELHRCRMNLDPETPAAIVGPWDTQTNWQLLSWWLASDLLAALAVHTQQPLVFDESWSAE